MKKQLRTASLLGVLLLLFGCAIEPSTTNQTAGAPDGAKTATLYVKSEKTDLPEIQQDVKKQLEDALNSGRYNVANVQTHYTQGFLTQARITYLEGVCGAGNGQRVMLILSADADPAKKEADVQAQMDELSAQGGFPGKLLTKTDSFEGAHRTAVEIYYQVKPGNPVAVVLISLNSARARRVPGSRMPLAKWPGIPAAREKKEQPPKLKI